MDTTTEALVKSKDSLDKLENARKASGLILKLLETAEVKRDNAFFDRAEKIFNGHYFQLKHMRLKRALNRSEIQKIFADKSILKKTVSVYREVHEAAATGIALISRTVAYCEIFYSLKVMFRVDPKSLGKDTLTQAQDKLFSDYKKMQALAGVLKNVASYAPPIVKDYMNFVLDFFIAAEAPIKMVRDYAQKIIKELNKIKNDNFGNNPAAKIISDTIKGSPEESVFR
jgi:hypothetical protein